MFTKTFKRLIPASFLALVVKEIHQILGNKEIIVLLTIAPIIQIMLYGFALNPDITQIKLGITDYANVAESRELVSALTENRVFRATQYQPSQEALGQQVREGKITVGLVIPPEFQRQLSQNKFSWMELMLIRLGLPVAIYSEFFRTMAVNYCLTHLFPWCVPDIPSSTILV